MNDFRGGGHVVPSLARFEWGPPSRFLGVAEENVSFEDAEVVILPVPYEATVSYMPGTKFGPGAIIDASRYIELYDNEFDSEPHTQGIYTLPELILDHSGPEQALEQLRAVMDELIASGKFIVMLGGEH
jgi:agmatinase